MKRLEKAKRMSNRIIIVGIGPAGNDDRRSHRLLEQADVIVGYTVYVKRNYWESVLREKLLGFTLCGRRQSAANCVLGRRKPGSG